MHYVIAGRINCPQFSYAIMVAQRLKENLPNFTYLKIPKKPDDWGKWLVKTCKENEWYHNKSPLIWREIGLKRGKKELIGNIDRFLDICYDFYGIPRDVLAASHFNRKEIHWFKNQTESQFYEDIKLDAKKKTKYRSRQICITGASSQAAEILIMELLQIEKQSRKDGLEIRLFDDPSKEKKLAHTATDAKYCPGPSGLGNCRMVTTLKEALTNLDLLIVLDSFPRKAKESLVKWLKRNRNAMCALGKALNMYAPSHCRVIIGSPSNQPICYNATVLASFATKLHVRNIVVVTQDLGREMLKSLAFKTKTSLRELYCPPVWGFIGLNKYVDIRHTVHNHLYKVPGKREHLTLPQGFEEYELRTLGFTINDDIENEILVNVSNHKAESLPQLGRWPCLAKATAIVDLLKLWDLKQEDGNGEIICLGVYSDGTFKIPQGIYWSQPVILKNGFWVPFSEFPVPSPYDMNCFNLFILSIAALYRTKIKPRRYVPITPVLSKDTKKFNFDSIIKSVDFPVIRTDLDCVKILKYLALNELGINLEREETVFDEAMEDEEIEEPEVVNREQIYCECWREELKELQRIVFDHSSTTEVEVDLSENLSGSEWSVINPTQSLQTLQPSKPSKPPEKEKVKEIVKKKKSSSSSDATVCSCSVRSDGSVCKCMGKTPAPSEDGKISTEHFYTEQNAQVFQNDLKDALYEDNYAGIKRVSFADNVKSEDGSDKLVKFYGKKNAIRDEVYEKDKKRRISKYYKDGDQTLDENDEEEKVEDAIEEQKEADDMPLSIHGKSQESVDIIKDKKGLEHSEHQTLLSQSSSEKSFRGLYSDEITPMAQIMPSPKSISYSPTSGSQYSYNEKYFPDHYGEYYTDRNESLESLESALDALRYQEIYGEGGLFFDKDEESEESKTETEKSDDENAVIIPPHLKWRREGVPVCCLCRCILPEGLPFCPCGGKTVVEVFKKQSVEVFIQSEDDFMYRIEYMESLIPPESEPESELGFELEDDEPETKALPPESFLPFSPKIPNGFRQWPRPKELSKEYQDSLKPVVEKEIPKKCLELLNLAKAQLEKNLKKEAEELRETKEAKTDSEGSCKEQEPHIKTDFSNLNLFLPEGIEDWRLTVQTKYREWFFDGPKLRDESYYDTAVEEISEDEFDVDKELELYFEN